MIVHITLNNELHTAAIIQLDDRKFCLLKYTVIFSKYTYSNGAFVDYISPNLLIRNMQSIGVSVLINKKKKQFYFLSLGDRFPFVLVDYFWCMSLWFVFRNLNIYKNNNTVGFRGGGE